MTRRILGCFLALAIALIASTCGDSTSPPDTPTVAQVQVTPASVTFTALGATQQFSAVAKDASGGTISGKSFTWSTSNATVVSVTGGGLATALANGAATLTATIDGVTDTAAVAVEQAVRAVEVTPDSLSFTAIGDTARLAAVARDSLANPVAGRTIAWASSDNAATTIDAFGLVTATGNGFATLTATVDGHSDTSVALVAQEVSQIEVTPSADTLRALGDSTQMTAVALDANGNPMASAVIVWTSSDTLVAAVDQFGLTTAVGVGSAEIVADADSLSDSARVTVALPPETITWTNSNGGKWTEPANWDLGRVPSDSDSVVIEMGSPVSTATQGDFSIRTLSLGVTSFARQVLNVSFNRTLRVSGSTSVGPMGLLFLSGSLVSPSTLFVQGELSWLNGELAAPTVVTGLLNSFSANDRRLNLNSDTLLIDAGIWIWTGNYSLRTRGAPHILLKNGGQLDIAGRLTVELDEGSPLEFENPDGLVTFRLKDTSFGRIDGRESRFLNFDGAVQVSEQVSTPIPSGTEIDLITLSGGGTFSGNPVIAASGWSLVVNPEAGVGLRAIKN